MPSVVWRPSRKRISGPWKPAVVGDRREDDTRRNLDGRCLDENAVIRALRSVLDGKRCVRLGAADAPFRNCRLESENFFVEVSSASATAHLAPRFAGQVSNKRVPELGKTAYGNQGKSVYTSAIEGDKSPEPEDPNKMRWTLERIERRGFHLAHAAATAQAADHGLALKNR
jgi:hypothetical protein